MPLILLIGLPGSGKSSLAQQLAQVCPSRQVISTDAIRAQLFGDEAIQGSWLKVQREVSYQFQRAVEQITAGAVSAAIYDATNVVRKQRRQAIELARSCGFTHITGLWLNLPLSLCLHRNQQRDRQVPEEVIYQMERRLSGAPPALSEGLDALIEVSPEWLVVSSKVIFRRNGTEIAAENGTVARQSQAEILDSLVAEALYSCSTQDMQTD